MILLIVSLVTSACSNYVPNEFPVFDPMREDDHSDFDLYDIISLSVNMIDHDIDVYTKENKQYFLDLHNIYRYNLTNALPQGSNEVFMEWNNTLEWAASEWLRYCKYEHGRAETDNMTKIQGQNMYKGYTRDIHKPMWMFYIEYELFYFNNLTCWLPFPKYQCGHMKQVLWAFSKHIGASRRSYCYPSQRLLLVNVHYIPKGNYNTPGYITYRYGWPCTRCPEGYLCSGKLCANPRQCRDYKMDCSCKLVCQNCGKPDWKNCKCLCKPGWDWEDCSHPCSNAVEYERKEVVCRLYDRRMCDANQVFRGGCHQFCSVCPSVVKTVENADTGVHCCGGKLCESYYALDRKTCECKLLCPSFICMFPNSTTTTTTTTTTTPLPTTAMTTQAVEVTETQENKEKTKKKHPLQDKAANISPSLILAFSLWIIHIIWMP